MSTLREECQALVLRCDQQMGHWQNDRSGSAYYDGLGDGMNRAVRELESILAKTAEPSSDVQEGK